MPDITIHDVPQAELDAISSRAARHGRSAEAELMHLIHEAAGEEMLVTELERATKAVEAKLSSVAKTDAPPRRRYRSVEPTPRRR
jgi:plasmid stability protein